MDKFLFQCNAIYLSILIINGGIDDTLLTRNKFSKINNKP